MMNSSPDLTKLKDIFPRYRSIDAVYLFGSRVTGKLHTQSDLDLAIYSEDPGLKEQKLDILADLAQAGFCDVDLVFLNDANIVLQFEVVRLNTVIYKKPDFSPGAFFSKTVRLYFDFYPYLVLQRKAYKERILNA